MFGVQGRSPGSTESEVFDLWFLRFGGKFSSGVAMTWPGAEE